MPVKMPEREYRDFRVEAIGAGGDGEEMRVRGYATTFENIYTLYSDNDYEIREVIDSHALDDTDLSDVIMQYDHQGRVFARGSNGTLALNIDTKGLAIDGELSGTDLGRGLYQEIAGGYTTKMSWGFKADRSRDVWTTEEIDGKTIETRRVMKVDKVYDVSAVALPANDATSISTRALVDGAIEQIKAERLEAKRVETLRKFTEMRSKSI